MGEIIICQPIGGFYDYSGDKADQSIKKRDAMYLAMARAKVTEVEPE